MLANFIYVHIILQYVFVTYVFYTIEINLIENGFKYRTKKLVKRYNKNSNANINKKITTVCELGHKADFI